jgi:hypothetical protein
MNTEQVIEAFSRAVANGSDNANVMSAATDIMGMRAAMLIPVFQDIGAQGIEPLADQLQKLGRIMSDETVRSMDEFDHKFNVMMDNIKNASATVFSKFIIGVEVAAAAWGEFLSFNGSSFLESFEIGAQRVADLYKKAEDQLKNRRTNQVNNVVDQAAVRAREAAELKATRDAAKAKEDAERESKRRADVLDNASFQNEQARLEKTGQTLRARARDIIRQLESGGVEASEREMQQAFKIASEQMRIEQKEQKLKPMMIDAPINDLQRIGAIMGGQTNQQRLADLQQRQLGLAEQQLAELRKIAADPVEVFA